mmetsp:Transcript_7818/g.28909  ORF Transcript_7818/g.28909 Transcript_7818/m.28909 type:complete len:102 (-) Transcript_7818:731-1036(-)
MRVSDAGSAKSAASCAVIPVLNRTFLGDAVASDERVALTAHMEVRAAVYNLPACRRSHTQPPSPRFVSGREEGESLQLGRGHHQRRLLTNESTARVTSGSL